MTATQTVFGSAKPERPWVLLADDDAAFREFIAAELRRRGIGVVCAKDAVDAVRYLDDAYISPNDHERPDAVITDLRMTRGDGFDVLDHAAKTWRLPTILVTAFGSPDVHRRAEQMGAAACIDKPFDVVAFCDEVERVARGDDAPA